MQRAAIGDQRFKRIVSIPIYFWANEVTSLDRIQVETPFVCVPSSVIDIVVPIAEATVLNNFRCAREAEYRHGNRNGCLKGTRGTVLDEIELWVRDFDKPPVYWLNGLAGTGKTTIAQTIAERTFADGLLGASFFCSRDFEDRSDLQFIFPTIGVQLARTYAEFRSIFIPLVESDPEIARESLHGQMNKLIVQPLVKTAISTVIVIDALDECKDEEPASAILSVLGKFVAEIPNVKFFVTGRPEPRIRKGFLLPLLAEATNTFLLHGVESSRVNNDIRLFFRHNFSALEDGQRRLDGWPTEDQLDLLCERSAGLFVHAMATIRFIFQRNSNPKRQLDRLLQSPESELEGKTKLRQSVTLNSLYLTILHKAFGNDDPENDPKFRSVLGAVTLVYNPLSPSAIASLLGFDVDDVFPFLNSAHSLLILQDDEDHPVRPFHKSFPDFIVNPSRCANPRFRVHPPDQHAKLLVGCLELMNQRLERNICRLPTGVINSEVEDLKERTERYIDRALEYACRFWYRHLVSAEQTQKPEITPVLHRFLEEKFLFWLEVLSVLDAARVAVDALEATKNWLDVRCFVLIVLCRNLTFAMTQASPTFNLASDFFRFLLAFFEVISISASHIYISALPLSPKSSLVREVYKKYTSPLVRVVWGLSVSWEQSIAIISHNEPYDGIAWSPCSRFLAVAEGPTARILDAVTLKPLSTFQRSWHAATSWLSFSPEGRILMQFYQDGNLASWDLQTGSPVDFTPLEWPLSFPNILSSAYSTDRKIVAVVHRDLEDGSVTIATCDLHPTPRTGYYRIPDGRRIGPIWTHGQCFRFATLKPESITIWETASASIQTPVAVEYLPVPVEAIDGDYTQFLPSLSRLAFTRQNTVFVWAAQDSRILLNSGPLTSNPNLPPDSVYFSDPPTFSLDGHFLACGTRFGEVHVWKELPAGYTPHQKFSSLVSGWFLFPLLSPNGESLVTCTRSTTHLWHTKDQVPPSALNLQMNQEREFLLGFSTDGTLSAFTCRGGSAVEILDLRSGDIRLIVDAGMEIDCLGVEGNRVVVVNRDKIVTWDIPAENSVPNTRASADDSVRTTIFDHPHDRRAVTVYSSISPDLSRVVIVHKSTSSPNPSALEIYDTFTGRCLQVDDRVSHPLEFVWFTPDGHEVWGVSFLRWLLGGLSSVDGWRITEGGEPGRAGLKHLETSASLFDVLPFWVSSRGYKVTTDGWVLGPTQKRLLWLPHRWRSWRECTRTWRGQFLGLQGSEQLEVVILEFFE